MQQAMIRVVSRNNIVDARWDGCVAASHNESIYGYSWYLDHIAPAWQGIILGDYDAVFPIVYKAKFGVSYLCQTSFFQRTAIYSESILNVDQLQSFYNAIPEKMLLWDFCVDIFSAPKNLKIKQINKQNLILDLNHDYNALFTAFNKNTKRNLKTALKNEISIRPFTHYKSVLETYVANSGTKEGYSLSDIEYKTMHSFMKYCTKSNRGMLLGAYNEKEFLGAVFFAFSKSRAYYLFSAVNKAGKESKALFAIVDYFIKTHQNTKIILDFEGSMNKGVARFYKGFGSIPETYYHIKQGLLNRIFTFAHSK